MNYAGKTYPNGRAKQISKRRHNSSSKYILRIHLLLHIIQAAVIPICYNRYALLFECFQVIDDATAKKCTAVFQRRLIDNNCNSFGFNPFHYTLDTALAEVSKKFFLLS